MLSTIVFVLLSTVISVCDGAVNYCGAKMCGYTNAHTFCQYPVGPSPSCAGYVDASLTLEEKVRILTRLNRRRNDAATGRLRRFPAAGDMLKLRWVEELAREAQRWADQCRPPQTPDEHDACRDLYSVSVGQNVASVVGEAPGLRVESMVDMWYMQNIHYKGNVTNYSPPMSTVNYYGDFAQIVWSYTYMVGCGRSRFMIQLQGRLRSVERLVCNFAPRGPITGQGIWIPEEPATFCPPRSLPDKEFGGICAYQPFLEVPSDKYNFTTIEENTLLNTIFDIEMNDVLHYQGSLDELYLTKIAIASLEDKAKTESYNNLQKRDVDTRIELNNDNLQEKDKQVVRVVQIQETTSLKPTQSTNKVKLIGRPKSYNADELIQVGGVQTTENYEIPADLPKERKEFYADYQYLENNEGETVLSENVVVISETSPEPVKTTENYNITSEITHPLSNLTKVNITYSFGEEVEVANLNISEPVESNNTTLASLKEDELLSDPEIVRDLELALRQMEQKNMDTSTATAASVGSEKVKRDLREISKEVMESRPRDPRDTGTLPPYIQELNMTVDKAPMLNMILKYLPYLKPYKKDILGKVTNNSINVSPRIVTVIVFIVFVIVV